jgi:hypothetical protein
MNTSEGVLQDSRQSWQRIPKAGSIGVGYVQDFGAVERFLRAVGVEVDRTGARGNFHRLRILADRIQNQAQLGRPSRTDAIPA